MSLRKISVASLIALLCGCYLDYQGNFVIPVDQYESKSALQGIDVEIFEAVRDLGFRMERRGDWSSISHLGTPGDQPDGASSLVAIYVDPNGSSIRIKDYHTARETEFMRIVKKRIEDRLRERYGITELKFVRDPGFPPS